MPKDHMKECIEACKACGEECEKMLFGHCLEMGGEHLEPEHVKLMADCIDICNIATKLMLRNSEFSADVCSTCADICDECADSCEELSGKEMKQCAEICRKCADICRSMADMHEMQDTSEEAQPSA
jgi:hypothetical protein